MATYEEKALIRTGDTLGNEVILYPITKSDCIEDLNAKKCSTFVVGHINSGHTLADCDYLCTGSDDDVPINQAITNLPANGGKIIILEGYYLLSDDILINKNNVTLQGFGSSTIIDRNNIEIGNHGFYIISHYATISNFYICNARLGVYVYGGHYSNITNNICCNNGRGGILIGTALITGRAGEYSNITGNICYDNGDYGICVTTDYNNTTSNLCHDNVSDGIYLFGDHSNVIGNSCHNNGDIGIRFGIASGSTYKSSVTGNTCYGNTNAGIRLNGSTLSVTGNACCNNGDIGIYMYAGSYNSISSNICHNNAGYSIHSATNATQNIFVANQTNTGIYVVNSYGIIIENNFTG